METIIQPKPGDIVFLKSDVNKKFPMTVRLFDNKPLRFPVFGNENDVNPTVTTIWINSQGKLETGYFPPNTLNLE